MISFNPFLLRCGGVTAIRHTPSTHLPSPRISVLLHPTGHDVDVVVTGEGLVCAVSHLGRGPMIIIKDYGYHKSPSPGERENRNELIGCCVFRSVVHTDRQALVMV
jgi:hypothetical protein